MPLCSISEEKALFGRAKIGHYERAAERVLALSDVQIGTADMVWQGSLREISLEGCSIDCMAPLFETLPITIDFADRPPLMATVTWATEQAFGCKFVSPISQDVIEAIAGH